MNLLFQLVSTRLFASTQYRPRVGTGASAYGML